MSAEDTATLARRLYDLFNGGQIDAAVGLSNANVQVDLVAFGQTFSGHDGFREFMNGFRVAFPDIRVIVDHQVATDTAVINECSWTGTHTGPLVSPAGEIPATGKRVSGARFCEVWDIVDGKISRLTNYQDVGVWLRQLGLA